jgi:hypothetical protein
MVIFLVIYYALIVGTTFFFHLFHGWGLVWMLVLAGVPLSALNDDAAEFFSSLIDFLIDLEIIEAIFGNDNN